MADWKHNLLGRIQDDLPITPTPYADLAGELGVSEGEIIAAISDLKNQGVIRRIGATIDSRRAGYVSTLVGCKVEGDKLEEVAAEIGKNPGVTHSYERDDELNLWFTLIAKDWHAIRAALERYFQLPGVIELHSMPADKVYKLRTHFHLNDE
jgi:DNA-binding Lrp family transcriptional regulator